MHMFCSSEGRCTRFSIPSVIYWDLEIYDLIIKQQPNPYPPNESSGTISLNSGPPASSCSPSAPPWSRPLPAWSNGAWPGAGRAPSRFESSWCPLPRTNPSPEKDENTFGNWKFPNQLVHCTAVRGPFKIYTLDIRHLVMSWDTSMVRSVTWSIM